MEETERQLETTPRIVGCLGQPHEDRDNSSVFVVRGIEEQAIFNEALNGGYRATATGFRCGTNNRYGSELGIQEEGWFGHDQIGLEQISNGFATAN